MRNKIAPLSGGFMLVGIFGFLFAIMFLRNYSLNWAFVIGSISVIVFIASMISTTYAPVEEELTLDEPLSKRKDRVRIYSLKEYKQHLEALKEEHKKELEDLKKRKPKKKSVKKSPTKKSAKKTTKKKNNKKKATKTTSKKSAKKTNKKVTAKKTKKVAKKSKRSTKKSTSKNKTRKR